VGWAINLYKAKTLLDDLFGRMMGTREAISIRMSSRSQGGGK